MTVACSCSNPTSRSVSLYYDGANPLPCDDTIAQYYGRGGNYPNAFEVDFVWGAREFFNVPTLAALAQAIQENGGHLNNWLQISQALLTTSQISSCRQTTKRALDSLLATRFQPTQSTQL